MPRFLRRIFNPTSTSTSTPTSTSKSNPFRSITRTTSEPDVHLHAHTVTSPSSPPQPPSPSQSPLQRTRRVLVRSPLDPHNTTPSAWKSVFFEPETGNEEEHMALRETGCGASLANSNSNSNTDSTDLHRPILASAQQPSERVVQTPRTRRRLSKKRRGPGSKG